MDSFGRYRLHTGCLEQSLNNFACSPNRLSRTENFELVASIGYFNAETLLNVANIFVELPAKICQPAVVRRFKHQLRSVGVGGH